MSRRSLFIFLPNGILDPAEGGGAAQGPAAQRARVKLKRERELSKRETGTGHLLTSFLSGIPGPSVK
tara:strand:- start:415 stop:615 length:201 start_codon:yes stop_codon:yes gene_type:complete